MTARIEELNEEAEHWRCLGKEADDKMDGLKTSLEVSREQIRYHEEAVKVQ